MTPSPVSPAIDTRFTAWLRDQSEPAWTQATTHRFTDDLIDGTIEDRVFKRYLIQDYAFVQTLTSVVGYATAQAPTMDAKRSLTGFLETLTDDENDYFDRAFEALGVHAADQTTPDTAPVTDALEDLLLRASHEGDYEETLAVLVPAEWIYHTWASNATTTPEAFYHHEWITLHATPEFASFVRWLRDELDTYGPQLNARRQQRVARLFKRTVTLEVDFFEMAYA